MKIRDRIKKLVRVPASELIPNPKNWRTHPEEQQNALRGVLAEVGIADALIARETEDGLQLIDGHLRADVDPSVEWPVLVLDVTEEEADKILLTHDPLESMAEVNTLQLEKLVQSVETDSEGIEAMLSDMRDTFALPEPPTETPAEKESDKILIEVYCDTETFNKISKIIDELKGHGCDVHIS